MGSRTIPANVIRAIIISIIVITVLFSADYYNYITLLPRSEPIILIPGYGNNKELWVSNGYIDILSSKGLDYGGHLRIGQNDGVIHMDGHPSYQGPDFYTLSFSDSVASISTLTDELELALNYLRSSSRTHHVHIVAFSLGGVISRKYLVDHCEEADHYVKTLVTISSPHGGVQLANLLTSMFLMLGGTDSKMSEFIEARLNQIFPVNSSVLSELVASGEGSYLYELNKHPHPLEVKYVSVIAIAGVAEKSYDKISRTSVWISEKFKGLTDRVATALNLDTDPNPDSSGSIDTVRIEQEIPSIVQLIDRNWGDLLLTSDSQNMNKVAYIARMSEYINTGAYELEGHHLNVLENRNEIWEIIKTHIID